MRKNTFLIALGITAALTAQTTLAETHQQGKKELKGAAFFTGGAAVGALAGGPAGLIVGAIGGALYDIKDNKAKDTQLALQNASEEIDVLEYRIDAQSAKISKLESKAIKKLEFQVRFATGNDELTFDDKQRLASLTHYLHENQDLKVRLDGYADPRGTDEYNNVLSSERAKTVATLLKESGIDESRIDIYYHGAAQALSSKNWEDYARERRVNIEVFKPSSTSVATAE